MSPVNSTGGDFGGVSTAGSSAPPSGWAGVMGVGGQSGIGCPDLGGGKPGLGSSVMAGLVMWVESASKVPAVGLLTVAALRSSRALARRLRMMRKMAAMMRAMAMTPPTAMPAMTPVLRGEEDWGARVYLREKS